MYWFGHSKIDILLLSQLKAYTNNKIFTECHKKTSVPIFDLSMRFVFY